MYICMVESTDVTICDGTLVTLQQCWIYRNIRFNFKTKIILLVLLSMSVDKEQIWNKFLDLSYLGKETKEAVILPMHRLSESHNELQMGYKLPAQFELGVFSQRLFFGIVYGWNNQVYCSWAESQIRNL